MLEWNVYREDWNNKSIKPWNIFKHSSFCAEVETLIDAAKHGLNRENFEKEIKRHLMYYFWSKSEYEIVLTSWPPYITDDERIRLNAEAEENAAKGRGNRIHNICPYVAEKIDVYEQVMLNFDHFIDYLWRQKDE